jgi:hypothetical protein
MGSFKKILNKPQSFHNPIILILTQTIINVNSKNQHFSKKSGKTF